MVALDLDEALSPLPSQGRLNEPREERVRPVRPGEELGVRLGRDVVRVDVRGELGELHERPVR